MSKWFSYCPADDSFEFHASEQEAKEAAEASVQFFREHSPDGWSEEVESACWGSVSEVATMTDKKPVPNGSEFDYTCDYQLIAP